MSNAVPYFLLLLQIATRPWSPDQGKTREMTKLCNHKRKLLLPCAAASPVAASCTLPVSPSTLSSGPTSSTAAPTAAAAPIHADSPTSPDKARKGTRPILLRLSVSPCLLFFFLFFFSSPFSSPPFFRRHPYGYLRKSHTIKWIRSFKFLPQEYTRIVGIFVRTIFFNNSI